MNPSTVKFKLVSMDYGAHAAETFCSVTLASQDAVKHFRRLARAFKDYGFAAQRFGSIAHRPRSGWVPSPGGAQRSRHRARRAARRTPKNG